MLTNYTALYAVVVHVAMYICSHVHSQDVLVVIITIAFVG